MRKLTVTLPDDLVQAIEVRVAAGDYASESDLVRDGLEGFLADDPAVDDWLRTEVAARYRKRAVDPVRLTPAEKVVEGVRNRFAAKQR